MLVGNLVISLAWLPVSALETVYTLIRVLTGFEFRGSEYFAVHMAGSLLGLLAVIIAATAVARGRGATIWQAAGRIQTVSRSRFGIALVMGAVLLLVVAHRLLTMTPQFLMAKFTPISEIGLYSQYVTIFTLSFSIVYPLAIVALILWINRQRTKLANA